MCLELLLQIAMVPSRERMLLFTTFADSKEFDPGKDHSRAMLDAKQAEYSKRKDVALETVVFSGEPTSLVDRTRRDIDRGR